MSNNMTYFKELKVGDQFRIPEHDGLLMKIAVTFDDTGETKTPAVNTGGPMSWKSVNAVVLETLEGPRARRHIPGPGCCIPIEDFHAVIREV